MVSGFHRLVFRPGQQFVSSDHPLALFLVLR
jgi:hypothetical protein